MDSLTFGHPWVLLLLVPVWAAVAVPVLRRRDRRADAWSRAGLTVLASGLLVVALAAPSLRTRAAGLAPGRTCIVEDVSRSVALARQTGPEGDALARLTRALGGQRPGLVQFAGGVTAVTPPGAPAARFRAAPAPGSPAAPPETDLAAALDRAAALLPEGGGLVLLSTDARQTRGDALRAARRLAARGLRVHALLPDLLAPADVRIVSVALLARPAAGEPVRLQVRLAATVVADVEVGLARRADGQAAPVRSARVRVDPLVGAALLFDDAPPGPGVYAYTVSLGAEADRVAENNQATCLVRVGDARQVACVYAGAQPSGALDWLRKAAPAGTAFRAVSVSQVRDALAGDLDLLVLDNVPAWALGREAEARLLDRVTRGALGLLVLGGDASFGAGGYGDAPIDALLPVASRTARRPTVALVLVIDASGSMNEKVRAVQKLALAKQAVLAIRPALGDADRVGVVAFAGEPQVVSPLVPASDWDALRARLLALQAGGGTRITPALGAALALLGDTPADPATVRHVLLLSDGRSQDFDVDRLVAAFRARGASLAAVATGADADLARLGDLARATGGRLYEPDDLARLAETFFQELAWVRGEGLQEGPRTVRWIDPEPVWAQPGSALGDVPACNPTRARQGASVHWATAPRGAGTDTDVPLLASWRRGLGQVAAMPWPVGALAEDRPDAPIGRLLGDVAASLAGPREPPDWSAEIVAAQAGLGAPARVRVTRRTEALSMPAPGFVAAVFTADLAAPREFDLPQVAPGVFAADLPADGPPAGLVVVRSTGDAGARAASLSLPGSPPREYDAFGVDRERLEAIVRAGGGQVHDSPESVMEVVERLRMMAFAPVGIYLVWAAGAVVAAQILLRLAGKL